MTITALDESGKAVDWWFIYKVPKLTQDANSDSATGYEYVYFDAKATQVVKSPNRLDQGKGALNLTLNSVFKQPAATTGWILYNDEKPSSAPGADDGNLGHTKGVIVFDTASKTAFWLLHSWPKYAAPGSFQGCRLPCMDKRSCAFPWTLLPPTRSLRRWRTIRNHNAISRARPHSAKGDALYALTQPLKPNPPADADVLDCQSKGRYALQSVGQEPGVGEGFLERFCGPATRRRHGRGNVDSRAYPPRR